MYVNFEYKMEFIMRIIVLVVGESKLYVGIVLEWIEFCDKKCDYYSWKNKLCRFLRLMMSSFFN